jgi:hypothetical protein
MQPILGCSNKYDNERKRKCNQFLVARLNIATITLVAHVLLRPNTKMQYFMIATNKFVAIEKYCHSKTTWAYGHITMKGDPLLYNAFATYQIWWQ